MEMEVTKQQNSVVSIVLERKIKLEIVSLVQKSTFSVLSYGRLAMYMVRLVNLHSLLCKVHT